MQVKLVTMITRSTNLHKSHNYAIMKSQMYGLLEWLELQIQVAMIGPEDFYLEVDVGLGT